MTAGSDDDSSRRTEPFAWRPPDRLAVVGRFIPPLLIVGLPVLLVALAVRPGQMLAGSDFILTFYYIRGAVGDALASGRLPVWDPHAMCGFPLLAGMQAAVLYPPNWLFALMAPGAAWNVTVVMHMTLAGAFGWRWLRNGLGFGRNGSLTGALLYMLPGFLFAHIYAGHVSMVSAYPWIPLVLSVTERLLRRRSAATVALLALATALLVLAGYPMFVFFAGLLVLARLCWFVAQGRAELREHAVSAVIVVGALAAGFLLAAPQLLPSLELVQHSQRAGGTGYEFATGFSMPPVNLLTLAAPTILGDAARVPYWGRWYVWEVSGFVGITALALALLGALGNRRRRWLWVGLFAVSLMLALGRYTPFYRLFYRLVPGASLFRSPGRYVLPAVIGLMPLAAAGIERLAEPGEGVRRTTFALGAVAVALCVALATVALLGHRTHGVPDVWRSIFSYVRRPMGDMSLSFGPNDSEELLALSYRNALRSLSWAAATLGALGGCLLALRLDVLKPKWASAVLCALLLIELAGWGSRFLVGYDTGAMDWPRRVQAALEGRQGSFRIGSPGAPQDIGRAQLAGFDHVGGYEQLMLRRYADLMNTIAGRKPDEYLAVSLPARPHPVLEMLGVSCWIARGRGGTARVLTRGDALPRAFVVPRAVVLPDARERLEFLNGPEYEPAGTVVLEQNPGTPLEGGPGTAKIERRTDRSYDIQVSTESGGYLVLTEAHYPGWRARVNGETVDILRANHFVQAVWVPAGEHHLRFRYESRWLGTGFALAAASAFLLAAAVLWDIRRRRA